VASNRTAAQFARTKISQKLGELIVFLFSVYFYGFCKIS
jgi:hypothetical protein